MREKKDAAMAVMQRVELGAHSSVMPVQPHHPCWSGMDGREGCSNCGYAKGRAEWEMGTLMEGNRICSREKWLLKF